MKETTKNLYSQFLDNGGTTKEFIAGRRNALRQAAERNKRHLKDAALERNERIEHLMDLGYTLAEARERLRLEAFEVHDAMGANPVKRVARTVVPQIGLNEMYRVKHEIRF